MAVPDIQFDPLSIISAPNKVVDYSKHVEEYQGFLSRRYPSIANPAPLGLCAFGLSCFILSMMNSGGLISIHASQGVVHGCTLFYGGLAQMLAGLWHFKTGNTYGALAFTSYGGFWMSLAAINIKCFGFLDGYTNDKDLHDSLGLYLLAWAMFTIAMVICAHRTNLSLIVVLFLVFLVFLNLSMFHFTAVTFPVMSLRFQEAGGVFGVVAAFGAWYIAFAGMLTEKNSLVILPVGDMDPFYRWIGWLPEEDEKSE